MPCRWLSAAAALSALAFLCGCATIDTERSVADYDRYRIPPYHTVTNGLPFDCMSIGKTVPDFEKGVAGMFVLVDTNCTYCVPCSEPAIIPVKQPRRQIDLIRNFRLGELETLGADQSITMAHRAGSIETEVVVDFALSRRTRTANTEVQGESVNLGMRHEETNISTANYQKDMRARQDRSAALSSESGQEDMQTVHSKGRLDIVEGFGEVSGYGQYAGNLSMWIGSSSDRLSMLQRMGIIGNLYGSDYISSLVNQDFTGFLKDRDMLTGLYGSYLVTQIFGEDMIGPDEEAAMYNLLQPGKNWTELLRRPIAAENLLPASRPLEAEMTASWFELGPVYHGHQVGLRLEVKNTGNQPLNEPLIINRVPLNTIFAGFTTPEADYWRQFYVAGREWVAWKLYAPIKPGERFQMSYIVTLDPWLPDWTPQE